MRFWTNAGPWFDLQLINMCSNDGQRMFEAAAVGSLLAGGPLIAVLGMGFNLAILGPTSLLGSAVFILFYPAMVSTLVAYTPYNTLLLFADSSYCSLPSLPFDCVCMHPCCRCLAPD